MLAIHPRWVSPKLAHTDLCMLGRPFFTCWNIQDGEGLARTFPQAGRQAETEWQRGVHPVKCISVSLAHARLPSASHHGPPMAASPAVPWTSPNLTKATPLSPRAGLRLLRPPRPGYPALQCLDERSPRIPASRLTSWGTYTTKAARFRFFAFVPIGLALPVRTLKVLEPLTMWCQSAL